MDVWKLTLLEVQVLCLKFLLHLYENLSKVLSLFPTGGKSQLIQTINQMTWKQSNQLLAFHVDFFSRFKNNFSKLQLLKYFLSGPFKELDDYFNDLIYL